MKFDNHTFLLNDHMEHKCCLIFEARHKQTRIKLFWPIESICNMTPQKYYFGSIPIGQRALGFQMDIKDITPVEASIRQQVKQCFTKKKLKKINKNNLTIIPFSVL